MMHHAFLPAEQPVRRMPSSITGSVRNSSCGSFYSHLEDRTNAASELPSASRVSPELMAPDKQGESGLRNLNAGKLYPACRLYLPSPWEAVTPGPRSAAGPSVKHMPDKRLASAWVDASDRNSKSPGPSGYNSLGAGGGARPEPEPRCSGNP